MARDSKVPEGVPVEDADAIFAFSIRARHTQAEQDALAALKARDPVSHAKHVRLANALGGVLDVLK
ncbi:MAG: hypothetical protein ACYCY2_01695 [Acidithiobacillus ferriphilus]